MEWYLAALRKYSQFDGRSRRKEYWFFSLFNFLALMVLTAMDIGAGVFDAENGVGLLSGIYSVGVFIPSISVSVRRLHDTDRSGWYLLLAVIPVVGAIVLFVLFVLDSEPGENRFGSSPKATTWSAGG